MKKALAFAVLLALATQASAISIVYENEASFEGVIAPGYYLNDFNNITIRGDRGTFEDFAGKGFAYTMTAPENGLWGILQSPTNGAMSTGDSGDALIISFTSGNVTAVGGTFSLTDVDGKTVDGTVKVTVFLNNDTSETFEPFAAGSFRGFTSDGPMIISLSFSSDTPATFPTLDNFYAGRVPDGGTTLVLLGGALTGLGVLRRKFRG
jgi:opacity protein-like surface antigen